ncbi:YhgE/Pip family protein, partial [Cellulomonas massiliensis]|uniref:YhgE/Pip family protein n=1 Tax=Cellulomonas massiliensis TaxID=1465811 RepID=UPI00037BACF6
MSALRAERVGAPRRTSWLTIVGLVLVPLVVGGLLTWALWEPTQRLERITAAVVNDDEPVELDGQTVPLGRQLSAALVTGQAAFDPDAATDDENVAGSSNPTSFTWILTDSAHAEDGVADGTYDAVVTIPKDFSAAATSSADPDTARTATISIATSPQARPVDGAIAQAIAQAAAGVTGSQLTQSYLEQVLVGFSTLGDKLGDAADGADQLADGVGQLGTGASGLADGAGALSSGVDELASGASGLSAGVGQLAGGASDLSSGIGRLGSGASDLSTGVGRLAGGVEELAGGLDQIADQVQGSAEAAADGAPQAERFASGLEAVAAGVASPDGLSGGTAGLAQGTAGVAQGLDAMLDGFEQLAEACRAGVPTTCDTLVQAIQAQQGDAPVNGQPTLTSVAGQVAEGAAALDAGVNTGTAQQPSLVDSLGALAEGGRALVDGVQQSAGGLATLADYIGQSADGAHQLADGAQGAADGAEQLAQGAS